MAVRGGGRLAAVAYGTWAAAAIGLPLLEGGLSPDNRTLLLALAFLLAQLLAAPWLARVSAVLPPPRRFVLLGMVAAAVVEGLHMTGMPVFASLRVGPGTSAGQSLASYAVDLAFTLPAYAVIFLTVWFFVQRFRYSLLEYLLVISAGQAIGDGWAFFVNAPAMLLFLPFPMVKYHAMNVLPLLAVSADLPVGRRDGRRKLLAFPALVAVYLLCGTLIKLAGRPLGYE